jgi:predicted metal-dependent phosphoesterase TrpH
MSKTIKIDLHTHSIASPDGALTAANYQQALQSGRLDYIAVTDHNTVEFALELKAWLKQSDPNLANRIIIGEEIRTTQGEIIGLYLKKTVLKMLSPQETVQAIREQGGLVCIPHPFEDVRRGMSAEALEPIASQVDMMEVHNGRAVFQNKSKQAYAWVTQHGCQGVASSDSHTLSGWGRTYTMVTPATSTPVPTAETLVALLTDATYQVGFPGFTAVIAPKFNRLSKRMSVRRQYRHGQLGDKDD